MRIGRLFALSALLLVSAWSTSASAASQCSDGIDNDGDGLIDFTGADNGLIQPDPQCRSAAWNNEASTSDMGNVGLTDAGGIRVGDAGAGLPDSGVATDGGTIPPGETAHDGSDPFEHIDGSTTSAGGGGTTVPNVPVNPPHQGCDVGGENAPMLPILMVLALGCGLALLSRRTRA